MTIAAQTLRSADLYEQDFNLWLEEQKKALGARDAAALDWDNLAEEIDGLAISEKRELRNRLKQLYHHLLKWQFQSERRCESWQTSIGEQRSHIEGILEDSPSLRRFIGESQAWSYEHARRSVAIETRSDGKVFPDQVPWPLDAMLDSSFMPGRPWSPEELIRD